MEGEATEASRLKSALELSGTDDLDSPSPEPKQVLAMHLRRVDDFVADHPVLPDLVWSTILRSPPRDGGGLLVEATNLRQEVQDFVVPLLPFNGHRYSLDHAGRKTPYPLCKTAACDGHVEVGEREVNWATWAANG